MYFLTFSVLRSNTAHGMVLACNLNTPMAVREMKMSQYHSRLSSKVTSPLSNVFPESFLGPYHVTMDSPSSWGLDLFFSESAVLATLPATSVHIST